MRLYEVAMYTIGDTAEDIFEIYEQVKTSLPPEHRWRMKLEATERRIAEAVVRAKLKREGERAKSFFDEHSTVILVLVAIYLFARK